MTIYRNNGADLNNYANNESLATQYRYNSLNQVVSQKTPDAGISKFWYDRLGRLVVSQNAKQQVGDLYSYTLYDALGRITEVGEKPQATVMTQLISQDTTGLENWITGTGVRRQITRTIYDEVYTPIASTVGSAAGLYQKNLRNRVSYTYVKNMDTQPTDWDAATFYTYDIHGNVDTLMQDYRTGMGSISCTSDTLKGNRFKKMVYSYDLISGKVNDVAYQPGQADQFYHRYEYDAENRLTIVRTSKDKVYWEREALYDYYRHGPLARTILGQNQVQGLDYAYTIQGWLKGVNSTAVLTTGTGTSYDLGQDGSATSLIARDAYGFSLNYFTGDYKSISTTVTPFVTVPMALPAQPVTNISTGAQLYNGNIGAMVVNIPKLGAANIYGYKYDQLNRIVRMDAFNNLSNTTNSFATTPTRINDYHEEISYDPNGNIKSYLRNGTTQGSSLLGMDSLTYQYEKLANGQIKSNKLRYVHDQVADANYATEDINSQKASSFTLTDVQNDISGSVTSDNYEYDAIGNLIKDTKEGITNIEWTVYGKISKITRSGSIISYSYDASGNRISKVFSSGGIDKATYYVRDASGNVMSVYTRDSSTSTNTIIAPLSQTELHLYGSSRLGVYNVNVDVQNCLNTPNPITIFSRGNKFFELSNHLGNVLVIISDKKLQVQDPNTPASILFYNADVVTANDYYPGGMLMPGRKYSAGSVYRYGFNGKENDNEVKGEGNQQDYGMRIYDPRLGRFLSDDPLAKKYPELTPYQFAGNMPINCIDLDGLEPMEQINFWKSKSETIIKTPGYDKVALTAAVTLDVLLTRGWASRVLFGTLVSGHLYHNGTKNPAEQKKRADDLTNDLVLGGTGFVFGKVFGSAISIFRGPIKEEVNYLFRGTTVGFEGSKASQSIPITPTSSDPGVATIFSIVASKNGKGILQIALPSELGNVNYSANVLQTLEKEIGVGLKPVDFAAKANVTITTDQARGILSELGIKLPSKISLDNLSKVLRETKKLSQPQISEFYKKAAAIQNP